MNGILIWDMSKKNFLLWKEVKSSDRYKCWYKCYGKVYGLGYDVFFEHHYGAKQPIITVRLHDDEDYYDQWCMGYDSHPLDIPLQKIGSIQEFHEWFRKEVVPQIYDEMSRREEVY